MMGDEILHVAIDPPESPGADLLRQVASILNKNLYETRVLLAGGRPKIVAHYAAVQAAESAAGQLRRLGLVAIVCRDSDLHKPSEAFRAHTMEFAEKSVLFWSSGGQSRRIEQTDAFLIIRGIIRTHSAIEIVKPRMKLSLAATAVTGGFPVWREVKERSVDGTFQTECFARIYGRSSSAPAVEMLQHHLDYSCLGAKMASASLPNFNTAIALTRAILPQAIFDDRLALTFRLTGPSATPRDKVETSCNLIHLCHQAAAASDDSA